MEFPLLEYRCNCGRLLFKGALLTSRVEVKCRRCGAITAFGMAPNTSLSQEQRRRYGIAFDVKGCIAAVSDTAAEILGYTRNELLSMRHEHLFPYTRSSNDPAHFAGVFPVTFETLHRTKSGTQLNVRIHATHPATDAYAVLHLCEVLSYPAAHTLHDRPHTKGLVVRSLLLHTNVQGDITYTSSQWKRLAPPAPAPLLGESIFSFFTVPDPSHYKRAFLEMAQCRRTYSLFCAYRHSGHHTPLTLHHTPTFYDNGAFSGYAIVGEHQGAGRANAP